MSAHCQPAARERARQAQREFRAEACVAHADLLTPATDPTDRWTLDIVVWSESGRVPAVVARILGEHDLDHRAAPQGGTVQVLAVA